MIDQNDLKTQIKYEPETGKFFWLLSGKEAGHNHPNGYRFIRINKILYLAHRVAWLYMTGEWPQREVDHRNQIKNDNRWENLRQATRSQNKGNIKPFKMRKRHSQYKGVSRDKRTGLFTASIKCGNTRYNLGRYVHPMDAAHAYNVAAIKLFKEFAHINDIYS